MATINRAKEALLTLEYLKSFLHYNPQTGVWTWLKRPQPRKSR